MIYKTDIEERFPMNEKINDVAPMAEHKEIYKEDYDITLDEQHNVVVDILFEMLATLNIKEISVMQIAYLIYRNWDEESILVNSEIDCMHSTYRVCEFDLHTLAKVSELSERILCVNLYNAWRKAPLTKNIFSKKFIKEVDDKYENEYGNKRKYSRNEIEDSEQITLKNRLDELIEQFS